MMFSRFFQPANELRALINQQNIKNIQSLPTGILNSNFESIERVHPYEQGFQQKNGSHGVTSGYMGDGDDVLRLL